MGIVFPPASNWGFPRATMWVGGWSRPEVEEMQLPTFGPEMVPSAWANVLKTRGSGTVAMASRQEKKGQTTNWYEINNIEGEKGRIS